jgi:hypothetical protein
MVPGPRAPTSINFGALAAERDVREHLSQYFVPTESYQRLRDGKKILALGYRGTGKTAILKMIGEHERARHSVVIESAPEDYAYELLPAALLPEVRSAWAKRGAYASAWKYFLYVLAMKTVSSTGGLLTGAAERIYNYVRDHHQTAMNPVAMFISYLKRLERIRIGGVEASLKPRGLEHLYRLEQINSLLDDLNEMTSHRRVVILVDEADRGFDASEDATAFLAGLFQAAVSIDARTPNIRVLMSLRRELSDVIPALNDDPQIVSEAIELIDWNEQQLLELVARRITASLSPGRARSAPTAWSAFVAATLRPRPGTSFDYVVDRTLYRPRDMIQFCLTIQSKAVEMGASLPLNSAIIREAERSYSEARTKGIAVEYGVPYPGLGDVLETFRGHAPTLDRAELELHCLDITVGARKVALAATWYVNADPHQLIEVLWRVGFIRAEVPRRPNRRRPRAPAYLGSHQAWSLNLRDSLRFEIHPMFRAYLEIRDREPDRVRPCASEAGRGPRGRAPTGTPSRPGAWPPTGSGRRKRRSGG